MRLAVRPGLVVAIFAVASALGALIVGVRSRVGGRADISRARLEVARPSVDPRPDPGMRVLADEFRIYFGNGQHVSASEWRARIERSRRAEEPAK